MICARHFYTLRRTCLSSGRRWPRRALHDRAPAADNLNQQCDNSLSLGERISDRVAEFGGSWCFIIAFFVVMAVWIVANSFYPLFQPFVPYPILLNLALSLLTAVPAPIILPDEPEPPGGARPQARRKRVPGQSEGRAGGGVRSARCSTS